MKLWMRRLTIIMMSVLTLGAYIPQLDWDDDRKDKDTELPNGEKNSADSAFDEVSDSSLDLEDEEDLWSIDEYIDNMNMQAREQMLSKLGPKIVNRVEDNLLQEILPQMEEVISSIYEQSDDQAPPKLTITEHPSTGYGEKIFHIYDEDEETDVVRFHVRRDMKPKQGYFFNFHYHLKEDGFEEHHTLGDVYWDKNTPPKWMAH
ncbi:YpjP family protein [Alkalicoccus daliensis]|uniref:YpjP-like protein n=1 Tax=Alkalicoccus daliensis TaxID=745820 RepID=A0A1H0KI00_9BACI|nr:YpjP family protein [Alkalicoccus daliensis]SDO55381.1 YpjP-like protein [Alkalicoccus daliensis]